MAFRERSGNKRANFRGIFNWLLQSDVHQDSVESLLGAVMRNFCHKHGSTSEFNVLLGVVTVMYFLDLY